MIEKIKNAVENWKFNQQNELQKRTEKELMNKPEFADSLRTAYGLPPVFDKNGDLIKNPLKVDEIFATPAVKSKNEPENAFDVLSLEELEDKEK